MPNSMTGFGRAERLAADRAVTVEARSVNNRFLTVKTRLPPRLLRLEPDVEELVRGVCARGTVEVGVRVRGRARGDAAVIDADLAESWLRSIRELAARTSLRPEVDVRTLLQLPGVAALEEPDQPAEDEVAAVREAVAEALARLAEMRAAEGQRLAVELERLLERAEAVTRAIGARAGAIPAQVKQRLEQRLTLLLEGSAAPLDPAVLEREVALLADRADVTEELARLASHLAAFRERLAATGAVGRPLDFLVQEMGREANTIGSKSQDAELALLVVELKTWIERIREQVQNLE